MPRWAGPALGVLALALMMVGAAGALAIAWTNAGIEITAFGWAMLAGGAVFSFLLGAGLMALVFISARKGFDERAAGPDEYEE
jgi:cation transporter-like permease